MNSLHLRHKASSSNSGFTLLELSIVLVIIGLITGGVLAGRSLIAAAQVRAQARDIQTLDTAIIAFKLKYGCLPGECAYATSLFTGTSQPEQVTNGSGLGVILGYIKVGGAPTDYTEVDINSGALSGAGSGSALAANVNYEWVLTFDHLAASQLYNFAQFDETTWPTQPAGVVYPRARMESFCYVSNSNYSNLPAFLGVTYLPGKYYLKGGHYIGLGTGGPTGAGGCASIGAQDAMALDSKIDDGKPYSGGTVLVGNVYTYRIPDYPQNNDNGSEGTLACADRLTGEYKSGGNTCSMVIRANF